MWEIDRRTESWQNNLVTEVFPEQTWCKNLRIRENLVKSFPKVTINTEQKLLWFGNVSKQINAPTE